LNKSAAAAAFVASLAAFGQALGTAAPAPEHGTQSTGRISEAPRVDVEPANVAVFAGAAVRFHARLVGGTAALGSVRWKAFGAGTIDDGGLYHSPPLPGSAASIVATVAGGAGGARVTVVGPPPSGTAVTMVACYSDGALEMRGVSSGAAIGRMMIGDSAGDVAIDEQAERAVATAGDRLVQIDLATMTPLESTPSTGARFGEVALLAGGAFAAVTNANAGSTGDGIAIFRLTTGAAPVLVSKAPAGDTPEGIAVDADGRTMYVTGVNSNGITRLVLNDKGIARKTGTARTGTRPFGIAVDSRRRMLLVADNDTPTLSGSQSRPGLEVFSLPSMRRIGRPLSTGSANALPLGVAVDPGVDRLFVTNEGDDDVAVYSLPSLRREATLATGRTPWLPTVDTRRHELYIPNARDDTLDVFDTRTLAHIAAKVPTCSYPVGVAVQPARPPGS
jgi:YVTN family beta-propeller protein